MYLTTDASGRVWFAGGNTRPEDCGVAAPYFVPNFFSTDRDVSRTRFRVIGSHENVALINALLQSDRRPIVELGTPMVCPASHDRKKPELLLYRMAGLEFPPSAGGWHLADYMDRLVYATAADPTTADIRRHPAYVACTFARNCDRVSLQRLMCLILDPRWYVDPNHPDRSQRLFSFLGLDPRTMAGAIGLGPKRRYSPRAALVLDSWGYRKPPAEPYHGRDFLWKAGAPHRGIKKYLRMSQRFVTLLRSVWLDAVSHQEVFVPEYFFRDSEAAEFSHYCEAVAS